MNRVPTILASLLLVVTACANGPEATPTPAPASDSTETSNHFGGTYYVCVIGDDTNPGTISEPWATIQHAAQVMVAGDTVMIRTGTYHEAVTTVNSGSASGGYITFSAYSQEEPVIDGGGVTESSKGFVVRNDYVRLAGLELQDWETGIWVERSHHVEICDTRVHDVTYGIGIADGTHDFVLDRVEMYHFDLYGFDASPSGGDPNYNGVINDCVAHSGRDRTQNVDGFALGHGEQYGFVFNRCVAYEVFDGFDISAKETTLNSCVSRDNNTGFKLWQDNAKLVNSVAYHNDRANVELDWDGKPGTTTLENCTLVGSGTYSVWVGSLGDRLRMYNTILAGGENIGLGFEQKGVENYQGDYNIFHNVNAERAISVAYLDEFSLGQIAEGKWVTYSGQDVHSLVVTDARSLFQNLFAWDLRLCPGSVAIDAGTHQAGPADDCDGIARPQGNNYDIGAYEYHP